MTFDSLDPALILQTSERLERRIAERFPDRGLTRVATALTGLAKRTAAEVAALEPPLWGLRGLIALIVAGGAAVFLWVGSIIPLNQVGHEVVGSVQGLEALINTGLLAVLGLMALTRLEARVKRRQVARGLHALRSVIHVIDMHQLTKDPVTLSPGYRATPNSPKREMTAAEMSRYLDYAAELLAITGKLAALYAQAVPDEGVAQAVTDIEMLGSTLARKIWQKITLIEGRSAPRSKRVPE